MHRAANDIPDGYDRTHGRAAAQPLRNPPADVLSTLRARALLDFPRMACGVLYSAHRSLRIEER